MEINQSDLNDAFDHASQTFEVDLNPNDYTDQDYRLINIFTY